MVWPPGVVHRRPPSGRRVMVQPGAWWLSSSLSPGAAISVATRAGSGADDERDGGSRTVGSAIVVDVALPSVAGRSDGAAPERTPSPSKISAAVVSASVTAVGWSVAV